MPKKKMIMQMVAIILFSLGVSSALYVVLDNLFLHNLNHAGVVFYARIMVGSLLGAIVAAVTAD